MSDEMKLLMALCDALGFEVECKAKQVGVRGGLVDLPIMANEFTLKKKGEEDER